MGNALYVHGFYIILPAVALAAWLWGGEPGRLYSPERGAAAALCAAVCASLLVLPPGGQRFRSVELGLLAVDVVLTLVLLAIALRADRWWPLWMVGVQLPSTVAHLARWVATSPLPVGYQIVEQASSWPTLLILAAGILRQWLRTRHRPATRG